MRLAVFTNQFPGGENTFFARDIAPLLKAGVDVEIFPFYPIDANLWSHVPTILSESILHRKKIHYVNLAETLRLKRLRLSQLARFICDTAAVGASAARFGVEPLTKTVYVALKAWVWAQQAAGSQYDHILAYWGNYAATSAYIFRRLTQPEIPLSIFLHAGLDLYDKPVYLRQKLLDADNIITCSEFNRQFMQQHFSHIYSLIADKIYVHYHGVELSEFRFQPDRRSGGKILAVGGLFDYKGFDYLLRAAQLLSRRGVNYEIQLVGDGEEAKSLKALANELQISDRVTFRGWVRPEEVPSLMTQATVLVHPSSRLADGAPNVIKEAMAVGTPVIASKIAGIPELLSNGEHGMLVPPKDVETLANAIETLLGNDALRLQYANGARRHVVEKFDLWRNGQRLADFLTCNVRSGVVTAQKKSAVIY